MSPRTRRPELLIGIVAALGAFLVLFFGLLLDTHTSNAMVAASPMNEQLAEEADPIGTPPSDTPTPVDEPPTPTGPATATPRPTIVSLQALATATATATDPTPVPVAPSATLAPTTPTRVAEPARAGAGVPILMYHYIRDNPDPRDQIGYGLSVPKPMFAAQMAFLAERGFQTLTMRDLAEYASTRTLPDKKSVVITLDDGYRDAYTEAYPELQKYGFNATIFMITDLIDNWRYLTKDQLRELNRNGIEIGSHSLSHADLPGLGSDRLRREVVESRGILEALLETSVKSFCYPSGKNSFAVRNAVLAAGYSTAVTVEPGVFRGGEERMAIPRVRVYGGMGLGQFARSLSEPPPDTFKWGQFAKDVSNPGR